MFHAAYIKVCGVFASFQLFKISFITTKLRVRLTGGKQEHVLYFKTDGINDDFNDYIEDLHQFVSLIVKTETSLPLFIFGHSMGGATSVTCGRREDISAVVDLDGTMIGENTGVNGDEIIINEEPYHTPLLDIRNQEHHDNAVEAERIGYAYSNNTIVENADTAYTTYFAGSGHMDFTDLPLFSPALSGFLGTGDVDNGVMIDTLNGLVLKFFDCYLKGEGSFSVNEHY